MLRVGGHLGPAIAGAGFHIWQIMTNKIRVAILEDHQSIIDGYIYRLKSYAQIEVVGEIFFGEELEPLLAKQPVDVLILDIQVPTAPTNRNPYPILYLIPRLLQRYPDLAILVISMLTERPLIKAVVTTGVNGYILKDDQETIRELGAVVISINQGGIHFSQDAYRQIVNSTKASEQQLTKSQLEILSLCASYPGRTTAELAAQMQVSHSTLRNQLSQAYLRLGVKNRAEAILKARELELITLYPPVGAPDAS